MVGKQEIKKYIATIRIGWLSTSVFFTIFSTLSVLMADIARATTSSSSTLPVSVATIGSSGSGNGQFTIPTGVVAAPNGDIYVVDRSLYRVQRFTSDGTFVSKWGSQGTGNGQFQLPLRVAADSNSNIYVSDYLDKSVSKFTSDGTFVTKLTTGAGSAGLYSVATDQNDNVYAMSVGEPCGGVPTSGVTIDKFNSSGTFTSCWSTDLGLGDGDSVDTIPSFSLDSNGNVYILYAATISGTQYSRIQKYTNSGVLVATIGNTPGSGNGQFSNASLNRITTDNANNLYVADFGNSRVQKLTTDGTFIGKWGDSGTLGLPVDISVRNNNVYVVDYNGSVKTFIYPQNIATITALDPSDSVNVTLPVGCNITNNAVIAPTASDKNYVYPLGLTSFTFSVSNCSAGATIPVSVTFQTTLKPSDVVARKYNSTTQTFTTIPDATITETTVGGQHALQLSYNVTDGGSLDEDGVANGVIVDPVGLGTYAVSPIGAPNTGPELPDSTARPTILLAAVISLGIAILGVWTFRKVTK